MTEITILKDGDTVVYALENSGGLFTVPLHPANTRNNDIQNIWSGGLYPDVVETVGDGPGQIPSVAAQQLLDDNKIKLVASAPVVLAPPSPAPMAPAIPTILPPIVTPPAIVTPAPVKTTPGE